jgi:hypothetical protein
VIKGCSIFVVINWQTLAALWAGALTCNKKNIESRTQLDELVECVSGGDILLLYTIPCLLFFAETVSRKKLTYPKYFESYILFNFHF